MCLNYPEYVRSKISIWRERCAPRKFEFCGHLGKRSGVNSIAAGRNQRDFKSPATVAEQDMLSRTAEP